MHSEDEAKTLECRSVGVVLAQYVMSVAAAPYGYSGGYSHAMSGASLAVPTFQTAMCIGSKCAMWRWGGRDTVVERCPDGNALTCPASEGWQEVSAANGGTEWVRYKDTQTGYCGLAGAPGLF